MDLEAEMEEYRVREQAGGGAPGGYEVIKELYMMVALGARAPDGWRVEVREGVRRVIGGSVVRDWCVRLYMLIRLLYGGHPLGRAFEGLLSESLSVLFSWLARRICIARFLRTKEAAIAGEVAPGEAGWTLGAPEEVHDARVRTAMRLLAEEPAARVANRFGSKVALAAAAWRAEGVVARGLEVWLEQQEVRTEVDPGCSLARAVAAEEEEVAKEEAKLAISVTLEAREGRGISKLPDLECFLKDGGPLSALLSQGDDSAPPPGGLESRVGALDPLRTPAALKSAEGITPLLAAAAPTPGGLAPPTPGGLVSAGREGRGVPARGGAARRGEDPGAGRQQKQRAAARSSGSSSSSGQQQPTAPAPECGVPSSARGGQQLLLPPQPGAAAAATPQQQQQPVPAAAPPPAAAAAPTAAAPAASPAAAAASRWSDEPPLRISRKRRFSELAAQTERMVEEVEALPSVRRRKTRAARRAVFAPAVVAALGATGLTEVRI